MKLLRGGQEAHNVILDKIKIKLNYFNLPIKNINCEYIYFIESKNKIKVSTIKKLKYLLGHNHSIKKNRIGKFFLIIPISGTNSTWSQKIKNILDNCGLNNIDKIERGIIYYINSNILTIQQWKKIENLLYDHTSEVVCRTIKQALKIFKQKDHPSSVKIVNILKYGKNALKKFNDQFQLALNDIEIEHLFTVFKQLKRNPNDAELYMFAQFNSEHCRHKIFNAKWIFNKNKYKQSLFEMIKNTLVETPKNVLSAYSDNAAVILGSMTKQFFSHSKTKEYGFHKEKMHIVIKAETHNHPTAISPFSGASTGVGGEIRDSGSTGRGSTPKIGWSGYSVSNLFIPFFRQPWEEYFSYPKHIHNSLNIMLHAPLGASEFNNEFGRPCLSGYFRTYEKYLKINNKIELRGYHKPIMLSGGLGLIREIHVFKKHIISKNKLIILGNPGMKVGLGGASTSSLSHHINPNFSSIQRGNPEMERRCQEVINRCCELKKNNPILFIHDVGAGGLSTTILEILIQNKCGAFIRLREIPNIEKNMTPLEIWCNESQERYVLVLNKNKLKIFHAICRRENAPYAIIGEITNSLKCIVYDEYFDNMTINLPVKKLYQHVKLTKIINKNLISIKNEKLDLSKIDLSDAIHRILHLPSVADKSFLITINDRSITGTVTRDQMIGPWQIPVSDSAVTVSSFESYYGEAVSIGERSPISLLDFAASARLSVGEAITNIAGVYIKNIENIKLSANWMIDSSNNLDSYKLYQTVKELGEKFCPDLNLTIVVGKDSMFMKTNWIDKNNSKTVSAPPSLVISACARVEDVRATVTPQLRYEVDNFILFIDLGNQYQGLAGTALSQTYQKIWNDTPDVRNTKKLKQFFYVMQKLLKKRKLIAYHDRSDGGLFVTLAEMAFSGNCSVDINLHDLGDNIISILFNEELGGLIQIQKKDYEYVLNVFKENKLENCLYNIGYAYSGDQFTLRNNEKILYEHSRTVLRAWWSETTWKIQRLRDNADSADQEHRLRQDTFNPGLRMKLTFNPKNDISAPFFLIRKFPKIAILREQGTNAYTEMAAAFYRAGFQPIDVHMNDLRFSSENILKKYNILVACGGFTYGDVLYGGSGWAKSILLNNKLRDMFESFFNNPNTLSLGICNGCQMMSELKEIIPGTQHWPNFVANKSCRFEARFILVEVLNSPSILLKDMQGSCIPISVAHSTGRVKFKNVKDLQMIEKLNLVTLKYIDNYGSTTELYPSNPNGSKHGIAALTNFDGRINIMMPHPERSFRSINFSYLSHNYAEEDSPWMRIFRNARKQIG
ncbi:phosphoribosylformyl-glycineamide synthetase [Wigglesworthia glossinidia endosymbiont of Glossina morsitans morsitans (Yale colony)]|uniref:Phosphoribosylformylglycinamidine synthase n=1 Tax=Wigglesworthia glossinidia endosymbiont of Glossina morsitans morsitans (Yale colony) TaxID=1142511 RepID=H6Q5H6_WIGGL|nr:phosphoribosylformylglycinamidine synthase [Wigglesworthia glossinidia]AFA41459.1 phosphoribosylformyl-glycineamide synthetase [Wigglesworthia glossinidia endosymbiont of Glossina morsitans morsitans (Yale colony)]